MFDMRSSRRAIGILFLLIACASASAITQEEKDRQLDQNFELLRNADKRADAILYENAIWMLWMQHPDADATRKMQDAMNHRRASEFSQALELLNELERDHPEWAEVYNQRATVYFHLQDHEASLQDVYEALQREPRHFGSLAGRGVIRIFQGKPALGYQAILEGMKLHPYLQEQTFLPPTLRPERKSANE